MCATTFTLPVPTLLVGLSWLALPPQAQEPSQEERLRRLEETVRRQEAEIRAQREGKEAPGEGLRAGYDEGFFVRSADGDYRFALEGLLQVNANFFERGLAERESEVFLRRMRFEFGGEVGRRYLFHVEPKFTEEDVDLEEAWVGADLGREGPRLYLGRMKEPFSLEEVIPVRHIDFVNPSILNQLVPAEQHGLTVYARAPDGVLESGAALYTGNGTDEFASERGGAARLVLRPFANSGEPLLERLQLGGAVTLGRSTQEIEGEELETEALVPFLEFEPGAELDGRRRRLGAEVAWLAGPFAAYGEAFWTEQQVEGAAGREEAVFTGGYGAISWVATGEAKTFGGVHPESPLRLEAPAEGGVGAIQLAARVSGLSLDPDLVAAGLVPAAAFPRGVRSYDLGINWYATYHARVKVHVLRTDFGDAIEFDGEEGRSEDALLLQFQFNF